MRVLPMESAANSGFAFPRWVLTYHWVMGIVLLALCVALNVHWPDVIESPGSGALALYPLELAVYVGLTLAFGLWFTVMARGLSLRRTWGARGARSLHFLVLSFGVLVTAPLLTYGAYLMIVNPRPASGDGGIGLNFSSRFDGMVWVMLATPFVGFAVLAWRCCVSLRYRAAER